MTTDANAKRERINILSTIVMYVLLVYIYHKLYISLIATGADSKQIIQSSKQTLHIKEYKRRKKIKEEKNPARLQLNQLLECDVYRGYYSVKEAEIGRKVLCLVV